MYIRRLAFAAAATRNSFVEISIFLNFGDRMTRAERKCTVSFGGRCPIIRFTKSKPASYCVKVWIANIST